MDYSLGYIKDLIAFFHFALFFSLVYKYDIHLNKSLVLSLLALGFVIDGIFSLYPSLHNMKINEVKFRIC